MEKNQNTYQSFFYSILRDIMRLIGVIFLMSLFLTPLWAKTLKVGPKKQFSRIEDAVNRIFDYSP